MDRAIEKQSRTPAQWSSWAAGAVIALILVWQIFSRSGSSRLRVDSTRITTAAVVQGEFHEYYPFDGAIEPATSVYLDIDEGGRVDEIFVEGGQHVEKGDLILRFSNAAAQQRYIETETRLQDSLNIQSNTEFNRAQSGLQQKETLLALDHDIADLENKYRRYEEYMKSPSVSLSKLEYENMHNQLTYLKDKRVLLVERIRQEEILSAKQIAQAKKSIERLNEGMELLRRIVRSLEVRAPISGFLSTIAAEIGQNIPPRQRIGQVDLLDKFKIRARIDQFYISRVQAGTPGHVNLDGKNWDVKVQKVYPEVKQNVFEADVVFVDEVPTTLKRGQSVTVELSFGESAQSLIVSKGGFYQQTAGRWVYLVSEDGKTAHRADVRLGRQNPREVEVLEGLKVGDRIVSSGYDTYNNVDELRFSEAITKVTATQVNNQVTK